MAWMCRCSGSLVGGVPDRRTPVPHLDRRRQVRVRRDTDKQGIPGGAAAAWVLKHAHVVEGTLSGVERRIGPHRAQLGRTLCRG